MELQNNCLGNCTPPQLINFNYAFSFEETETIKLYNQDGCEYDVNNLEYAYSLDNVCWSCYVSYQDLLNNTVSLNTDFYLKIKVKGIIGSITINSETFTNYTTSLYSGFTFTACDNTSSNVWNPYINTECAIALNQQITEYVSCMFGVPIYYFKLAPNTGSKDITFKEYTLMDVDSVKQIKMLIADNQMPSSKPEFAEFGFEFQNDWEVDITKGAFATAFGNTAQPMEGDIIWVPMMKRMWMVNEAYEEKKDAFMWNATTFKLTLVKYQEKGSVNLGDTEALVNTFVKNKYDDLFGDDENLGSGEDSTDLTQYEPNDIYSVYESDSTRKYITSETISFEEVSKYQKGTLISDLQYKMNNTSSKIVYQHKYCGNNGSISFIITPSIATYTGKLLSVAGIELTIHQNMGVAVISLNNIKSCSINLQGMSAYFIYLRWSKDLNIVELSSFKYKYPSNMPLYKLQPHHYQFDINNPESKSVVKYDIEMIQSDKGDITIYGFKGSITNIKIFDIYVDNITELLQMYPTNSHLLVNDTARKLLDLNGVSIR